MSELTEEELDRLDVAWDCGSDAIAVIESIIDARTPRIEAAGFRRLAAEADEIAQISQTTFGDLAPDEEDMWFSHPLGSTARFAQSRPRPRAAIADWLRMEADRLDPKET